MAISFHHQRPSPTSTCAKSMACHVTVHQHLSRLHVKFIGSISTSSVKKNKFKLIDGIRLSLSSFARGHENAGLNQSFNCRYVVNLLG